MLALGALESPQISTVGALFDLSQLHAALTVGAARAFNGKQRWVRTIMSFGHVMHHPCMKAGARRTLSHR